ncbi:mannitol-1-phosphate 5-dehydrogenase [Alkalibacter saccharofermentans]|uniref:Mannitol-1-phosphate 5-dehydrogenase n=1 Tax=Alkalibacter saccharofermentans DSM 14828 TaxID=1120975 RepID=A0A1M4YKZ4_9FIRM|nr:mannitol-1-phosphate 5-dehydrogenase [Alkalibacter saccharofermentans]SHF06421.1 mannitol-1-phosphate 5-dehydrogenase [Alkalibacter saccharofermentans DSM 14828]
MGKIAVHFGAGNIGRGFIGLLLAKSGYEVYFVDVNEKIIDELNLKGKYDVIIAGKDEETLTVENVGGISGRDEDAVVEKLLKADLVTTAVGVNILPVIAKTIAKAIEKMAELKSVKRLNFLACENAVGNSDILKASVYENLTEEGKRYADENLGFPNTTVDRIVPEAKEDKQDVLSVAVEPFFEWNVEKEKLVGDVPKIEGMNLVDNLPSYIERKLFTLNTAHAVTAYLGYQNNLEYVHQAINDGEVRKIVVASMGEVGQALVKKHGFDMDEHQKYMEKIISRFENTALADPVERVGRDPLRKLGPTDRLIAPARTALSYGIVPENLIAGILAALSFKTQNDPKSIELDSMLKEKGLEKVLEDVCGLSKEEELFKLILKKHSKS